MDVVGRVAADTLGYITADIPGAVLVDKFYTRVCHTLTKSDANPSKSQKESH